MLKRKKGNICGYWDCKEHIPENDFLCERHYEGWANGLVDRCPQCGRFKETMYQLCLDCYAGRPVARWEPAVLVPTPKHSYKVEYSDTWVDGFMEPDRVFVYMLESDGEAGIYVGHTTDIRKRLIEHRDGKIASAAGHNPRLQYLEVIANQKAAEARQSELKRLIETNPNQIRLMISEFHRLMHEFRLEDDSSGYPPEV